MNEPAEKGVVFRPIGRLSTRFKDQAGTPIQSARARSEPGIAEVFPEFREGLCDLEGFSHVFLIYHLHKIREGAMKVVPYLDDREHGIFSTRSPKRPNPIGMSIVRVQDIEDGMIHFLGADMLDGTPLLDIKPYVPDFDHHPVERIGWYATAAHRNGKVVADDRFSETLSPPTTSEPLTPSSVTGRVVCVCISPRVGTAKEPVAECALLVDQGLEGDAHAGTVRQISLLMSESVSRFNSTHHPAAKPGDFAENIQTEGIDLSTLHMGDRLRIGAAILEVTQIGKETKPHHYSFHGKRLLPTEGVFCRVIAGGAVMSGTPVEKLGS